MLQYVARNATDGRFVAWPSLDRKRPDDLCLTISDSRVCASLARFGGLLSLKKYLAASSAVTVCTICPWHLNLYIYLSSLGMQYPPRIACRQQIGVNHKTDQVTHVCSRTELMISPETAIPWLHFSGGCSGAWGQILRRCQDTEVRRRRYCNKVGVKGDP